MAYRNPEHPPVFGVRNSFSRHEGTNDLAKVALFATSRDMVEHMAKKFVKRIVVVGTSDEEIKYTGYYLQEGLAKAGADVNEYNSADFDSGLRSFDSRIDHRDVASYAKQTGLWIPAEQSLVIVGSAPLFSPYFHAESDALHAQDHMRPRHRKGEPHDGGYQIEKGQGFIFDPAIENSMD